MWGRTITPGPIGCSTTENEPPVCCSSILKSTPNQSGETNQTDLPSPAGITNFDMVYAPSLLSAGLCTQVPGLYQCGTVWAFAPCRGASLPGHALAHQAWRQLS